jgi:hypothetical protein
MRWLLLGLVALPVQAANRVASARAREAERRTGAYRIESRPRALTREPRVRTRCLKELKEPGEELKTP